MQPPGSGFIDAVIAAMTDGDGPPPTAAEMEQILDRFNSLPFDERSRILGLGGPPVGPWSRLTAGLDLPPAPPPPADLAERAASAPFLDAFTVIREFMGEGRKLTAAGNPGRADALALAEALGDPMIGYLAKSNRTIRSADDLGHTQMMLRWARAAGAVRVTKGKMAATASWNRMAPAGRVARAVTALLDKGPLSLAQPDGHWAPHALHQVLEDGLPHILALLWAMPEGLEVEALVDAAFAVCDTLLRWGPATTEEMRVKMCRGALDDVFELLGRAEVVERSGSDASTVRLTALGWAVLGPYLEAHGFEVPEAGAASRRPLPELIARVGEWHPERIRAEFDQWVAVHGPGQAVEALAAAVRDGYPDVEWPLAVIDLAERLPGDHCEEAVRALLDTPARGHAMTWLIEHERGGVPDDAAAMTAAGVEMLALAVSRGDDDQFRELIVHLDDPLAFIADCAALPGPASLEVLRATARTHPDAHVAAAARKAAMRRGSAPARMRPPADSPGRPPTRRRRR